MTWTLEPNGYGFRIEFDFVDGAGTLLKTKTWELRREKGAPVKTLLLQAETKLLSKKPEMIQLGNNFFGITIRVSELSGELITTSFSGFDRAQVINQQLAAFPVSLGVVIDDGGIRFTLHRATIKES